MLDTNAIIMAVRHKDGAVYRRIRDHVGKDLCVSSITYGELVYGIQKSAYPERNRIAVNEMLLGIRIIDFDARAAEHFGDIFAVLESKNMRIGDRDMLIAAHARSCGDIVVTNNKREFERVDGLKIEDWSKG